VARVGVVSTVLLLAGLDRIRQMQLRISSRVDELRRQPTMRRQDRCQRVYLNLARRLARIRRSTFRSVMR
jgi:hypothetical protein